jgi:hypothetical protein
MPKQIVFTSTPTGLHPGRSGFQIVAQHPDLSPRLCSLLSKESTYEFPSSSTHRPTICRFQIHQLGEERFMVLSRMRACGVDATGRPNHVAHHLIFEADQLPQCPPAALFLLWKGWRNQWDGKPRQLGTWDRINLGDEAHPFQYEQSSLPAKQWKERTGDEGNAAIPLLAKAFPIRYLVPEGEEDTLLWLFFETQSLIPTQEAWRLTFTNCLTEGDELQHYRWMGVPAGGKPGSWKREGEELRPFDPSFQWNTPTHALADKARKEGERAVSAPKRKKPNSSAAVSISPIQEELELESTHAKGNDPSSAQSLQQADEMGDCKVPSKHPASIFADIHDTETQLPSENAGSPGAGGANVVSLQPITDSEATERSEKPKWFWPAALACLALMVAALVWGIPSWVAMINQIQSPSAPQILVTQPADSGPEKATVNDSQRVDAIIDAGEMVLARALLAQYREHPQGFSQEAYQRLSKWFESQQSLLETLQKDIGALERDSKSERIIPRFEARISDIRKRLTSLASSMQSSLLTDLDQAEQYYRKWIESARLKTESAPTFFMPISRDNPNPTITYTDLDPGILAWFDGLNRHASTRPIEHLDIHVSEFKGLNQFELQSGEAIKLSLWKHEGRSLLAFLDGQHEVISIEGTPDNENALSIHWRFAGGPVGQITRNVAKFPEPPLILRFFDRQQPVALNVVLVGGVSQSLTIPAEAPLTFLSYHPETQQFELADEVLHAKVQLFLLPPTQFLKLHSRDERFQFAWDNQSKRFHLYDSSDLKAPEVQEKQEKISSLQAQLQESERKRTICDGVQFLETTPIWALGASLLGASEEPSALDDFGWFCDERPATYFEYLQDLFMEFAARHTLIRPSVMREWLAYPNRVRPVQEQEVLNYRNMLLNTAKRLRSLLKEEDPQALEHWRNFVTNLEFWMLGEHEAQLLQLLGLSAEEIAAGRTLNATALETEGNTLKEQILSLQNGITLAPGPEVIAAQKAWLLEIASLDQEVGSTPLILFK